jgi:putative flippase GtrA
MKLDYIFIKFILVGILNTIFGYSLFAILLYTGLHYTLAVILSTIIGILFNFKTIGILVFKNKNNKLIFKFFAVYATTCSIGIIILRIAELLEQNLYFSGIISTGICAIISYLLNKKWVFKYEEN